MKFVQVRVKMKKMVFTKNGTGVRMLNTVRNFIHENNMINEGDRIVIGVSGGADSVCLFHVLHKLSFMYHLTLFVVHVNHGIRGEEAEEDEAYVKQLCLNNNVSYTCVKADVPAIAKNFGLSEEEAGRKVRYETFNECFLKNKCNKIAIAHNKNDNAETILFHLFRGSGIKGLKGIPAVRGNIIRPLLCMSRDEIEQYLEENGISYQTDRTNLIQDYTRNKIRHTIISFAKEEINPKVIEHIVSASEKLTEIDGYLEKNIKIAYEKAVCYETNQEAYEINIDKLRQEDLVIQKGIIRKILEQLAGQLKDVEALHIGLILELSDKPVGKSINLPYGILASKGYHSITLKCNTIYKQQEDFTNKRPADQFGEQRLNIPGDTLIPGTNQIIHTKLINYKKNMIIPRNGCTKWFDYDKIKNTVLIRTRKEGDYIQIDSAGSRKKIKALFIDEKIPREKRDLLPLLADGAHIMWVTGGRMSEAYKVSEETKVILEINLDGGK
ncbi:tRNA lysidine(34) synthetase TilS [Anaerocolumna sp. MB42-C2]|uniref:tRNA lysidine(34) synthetase TilS n=1 Tax=Anaerocolumna sp. MB42-C2 TaxID=3070997 RepID=UPI0027E00D36|nr:tRNA lysidine(34) synthetase TilS [Anaerocolumna sp. MB42-C2]WMJ90555.1 tRNA lysidine(34) synthetase TilS [Anaerocolumna sp. MB42-C2]